MSSTRYAADDGELQQQRWASDRDFSTSVNALLAAKRIALITDHALRDLLWFVQWRSLEPRGLRRLAEEIIQKFPDRLGTPRMRSLRLKPGKKLSRAEVVKLRGEFPDGRRDFVLRGEDRYAPEAPQSYYSDDFISKVAAQVEQLHEHLMQICVDPGVDLEQQTRAVSELDQWLSQRKKMSSFGSRDWAGVWYFDHLLSALRELRSGSCQSGLILAETEASRQINGALDFCFRRRRMVLIEGKAGIGKTETVKAWCERQRGLARHVEVPSSNDDRSFFASIAEAIGAARGTSYNGQQIKLRVEEALRASGLMLVLDEGQFLWPQYIRPQGIPARIQWLKTAFDAGTPIALVALPKFSEWQQLYAKRMLWDDDQLERRLNRKVLLPDAHSKEDLLKIARARHPEGDKASWALLTGYALVATKKQASAITEALESAQDIANQQSRDSITYDDIDAAVKLDLQKPLLEPDSKTKHRPQTVRDRSRTDCQILTADSGDRLPINRHRGLAQLETVRHVTTTDF